MSSTSPNQASKRKRVPGVDSSNIIEGESRRAKRRKDGSPVKVSGSASSLAGDMEDDEFVAEGTGARTDPTRQNVSELGLKLLETLRKATNSSGMHIANDFKKLPNKRMYPDYYELIKQPIAFDDIKARIDAHGYASLEDVKADFDLCFRNAKRYNMKNSDIWIAARDLQRMAATTFKELQPHSSETDDKGAETQDEDDDDDDPGVGSPSKNDGAGEKRKAGRPPMLYKKYETRLNKLIEKNDDGYYHSEIFMDVVNRKDYPDYYQVIKKPISFNMILKRIKRKEYPSPKEFMDDVELVFTNAVTYNEDHSQIWEDAKILQATFHTLCADWRAEYGSTNGNDAGGSSSSAVPKLKLKVPHTKAESVVPIAPQVGASAPTPHVAAQHQQPQSTTDPRSQSNHITRSQVPAVSTPLSSSSALPPPGYGRPTPPILPPHLRTSTPSHLSRSPSVQAPHPPVIKGVELVTHPAGRRIPVQQGGISRLSAWSIRLGWNETSVTLTVQLASDSVSSPAPGQNGLTNGNGVPETDAVEIKNNAVAVASKPGVDKKARWDVPLVVGTNSLEVRVRGTGHPGNMWRISVDRTM